MMKVLVDCGHHSAMFDLPHSQLEVSDYLLSAGIQYPYADLMLNEDDSPDIAQVKLIAETSIDNWLQSLFSEDDLLSTVNTVCDLLYRLSIPQQIDLTHRSDDPLRMNCSRFILPQDRYYGFFILLQLHFTMRQIN